MLKGNNNVIITKRIYWKSDWWLDIDMTHARTTKGAPCAIHSAHSGRLEYSFSSVGVFETYLKYIHHLEFDDMICVNCYIDDYLLTAEDFNRMDRSPDWAKYNDMFLDLFYPEI